MVAITMEVTSEAMTILTDRCPFACVVDIRMQEELQVLTISYMLVEFTLTEVVELLELRSTIGSIIDIYLGVTFHSSVVHIVVMLGIIQHLLQVVVVCHTQRYMVRISLTQIGLGIVSDKVTVLIPIERIEVRRVLYTIDMTLCVSFVLEDFPSTTSNFISTRCYDWFTQSHVVTRQDELWHLDILH